MLYKYKGQLVTASSKKEAIFKIKSNKEYKFKYPKELLEKVVTNIDKKYTYLYDHGDNIDNYEEILDGFENFLSNQKNKKFIQEVVRVRGDILSSDREGVAFMLALKSLGLIDKDYKLKTTKVTASSKWSESELSELGLTEKELKQFSDKTKKEVCKVS